MITMMLGLLAITGGQQATALPTETNIPQPPAPAAHPSPFVQQGLVPASRATANLPRLFSYKDYPEAALRNQETGDVSFVVAVDRDGRVTNCTVTTTSRSESLDEATCSIIRSRARFRPARDAAGNLTVDLVEGRIRWALPLDAPLPFVTRKSRYAFVIDAKGHVGTCLSEPSHSSAERKINCSALRRQAKVIAKSAPQANDVAGRHLVFETSRLADEVAVKDARLEHDLLRFDTLLTIDAKGTVTKCEVVANIGVKPDAAAANCSRSQRFAPLGPATSGTGERRMTLINALYLRRP